MNIYTISVCGYVHVYPDVHGGQKRATDFLELELQAVVSWEPL